MDAKYYTCNPGDEHLTCNTINEAVEDYLGDIDRDKWPEEVTVYGFNPMAVTDGDRKYWQRITLDELLERVDEEYGSPEDDISSTEAMEQAARTFVDAVLAEYDVWRCEEVSQETVNVAEWVRENAPHWLEEGGA